MNLTVILLGVIAAIWVVIKIRRRFRPGVAADPVGFLDGPGTYQVEVVGESHYQAALERACGGRTPDGANNHVEAMLTLEDRNRHDPNAVRVDVGGRTVGYLSRPMAKRYRQRLREAGHPRLTGKCSAVIRGGWERGSKDRGHFGIWLDLPTTESDAS